MKLSELVDLYNGLSTLGWTDVKTQADAQAQKIIHELNRGADPVLDNLQQAQHNVHVIQETFDRLETDLNQVKDKESDKINQKLFFLAEGVTKHKPLIVEICLLISVALAIAASIFTIFSKVKDSVFVLT
jgi:hypothetical protein